MPDIYNPQGRLIERRDDGAQTVTTYDPVTGAVVSTRPYTPAEVAALAAVAAAVTEATNNAALTARIRDQITALKTLIGAGTDPAGTTSLRAIKAQTNAVINAGPAPYVKANTDALIDISRAVIRLSRMVARVLDSASD